MSLIGLRIITTNPFDILSFVVGHGNSSLFQKDTWIGSLKFQNCFPIMYAFESSKLYKVINRCSINIHCWCWLSSPISLEAPGEILDLNLVIEPFNFTYLLDKFQFLIALDHPFLMDLMRYYLDSGLHPYIAPSIIWVDSVPSKVLCFIQLAKLNSVLVVEALIPRGTTVQSGLYPYYHSATECIDHLLTGCSFASNIWDQVFTQCNIPI